MIASNAAGIPFTEGMALRLVILLGGLAICVAYVMRYASKVKADPARSVVAAQRDSDRLFFLNEADAEFEEPKLSDTQKLVLILFFATFAVMIWGVSSQGWWMARMGALFFGMAIVVGLVARMGEKKLIMEQGLIADTILNSAADTLGGLPQIAFINLMLWIEIGMSFLVPSSSGLAVLSMPILAPLGDFAGVGRDLVVTAYQSASGLVNLITPTSAVVIGGLTIGRVSFDRWLVFIWPLLLILVVFISAGISLAAIL